jgi:hypothetical protein
MGTGALPDIGAAPDNKQKPVVFWELWPNNIGLYQRTAGTVPVLYVGNITAL